MLKTHILWHATHFLTWKNIGIYTFLLLPVMLLFIPSIYETFIPLRNLTVLNIWMDLSSCYWNGSLWIKYWQHTLLLHLVIAQLNIETSCTWRKPLEMLKIKAVKYLVWYIWFYHLGKIMTHPTIIMINILF